MRIYLDLCALKRSFDEPAQDRVILETLAVAAVVAAFEDTRVDLVSSTVLELENSKNPERERREAVASFLSHIPVVVRADATTIQRGREVEALGFRPLDALHVACAEKVHCDYLVTCDDGFLRRASRAGAQLLTRVIDPLQAASLLSQRGEA